MTELKFNLDEVSTESLRIAKEELANQPLTLTRVVRLMELVETFHDTEGKLLSGAQKKDLIMSLKTESTTMDVEEAININVDISKGRFAINLKKDKSTKWLCFKKCVCDVEL